MPELPEVETIRLDLQEAIPNQRILDVKVLDARVIRNSSVRTFARLLKGKQFVRVERRGKALILPLDDKRNFLVVQPMMTGQLVYSRYNSPDRARKVTFTLSNGRYLHYNDQRLFGRLQVVENIQQLKYFQILGPEPLSRQFNVEWLKAQLLKRQMPIKTLLMNHNFVAGIGNIYASEILFRCSIHPQRPAQSLKEKEIKELHAATIRVLKEAIVFRGTSMFTYRDGSGKRGKFMNRIKVYGKENEECPSCQNKIIRIVLSGRSTFFCKRCQN